MWKICLYSDEKDKMTEENLKTLKDLIDEDSFDVNVIMPDKLRQWAVEHIKDLSKEINPPNTPSTSLRIKNEGIIDWISENFNITKEDLK